MPDTDPAPTLFVLYGATGDLAKRMVLPAFYQLAIAGLLPRDWLLVGNGRGDVSHEDFTGHVHDVLTEFGPHPDDGPWEEFSARLRFAGGGFNTDDPGSLLDVLAQSGKHFPQKPQLIHYFAVPPSAFTELTKALGEHDLAEGARVIFEKPFGTSPDNFRQLDEVVHSVLDEKQVFRIDHFLGKEATQDLHVLRFANRIIGDVWNREHVSSVQIDVPETLDVADRADFYDHTGALLDMIVTHLFQVAAEVAMEPPTSLDAEGLQTAREAVISAFRPLAKEDVVLGQYEGYRDLEGIADDSTTDTFVAARLWIDTHRWRDVPFLLRTGKLLAKNEQRVTLVFRDPEGPIGTLPAEGSSLSLSLSGSGEIDLTLTAKQPGVSLDLVTAKSSVALSALPGAEPLPPYVRLIHDVMLGDRSLFTRPDGLEATWKTIEPILADRPEVEPYAPKSWGPASAAKLAEPGRWLLGQ